MGRFNQSVGSEQITFQKVIDSYKSLPLGIMEVFKPEVGWYKPTYDWRTPTSVKSMSEDVWHLAMSGVTDFAFEVMDEFETLKYPDFSLNELVK